MLKLEYQNVYLVTEEFSGACLSAREEIEMRVKELDDDEADEVATKWEEILLPLLPIVSNQIERYACY